MWQRSVSIVLVLFASSCGFQASVAGDATPLPEITVGFERSTTQTDEKSGTIDVGVALSQAADTPITVRWEIAGGGALPVDDFTPISLGTLTFAPGETRQQILIEIKPDTIEEGDESIVLALAAPTGAKLGPSAHEVRISANVLPRVRFAMATTSASEPADGTLDIALDTPSNFPITVDYVIANTSTATTADHTLSAGTVTFAPGVMAQTVTIDVVQDALDEHDETIAVTLQDATNAIVLAASNTQVHTILDEDPEPTVSFALAASTVAEAGMTTNVVVTLSAPSGRAVTVPFSLGVGSATAAADFTLGVASPLTFAEGETTKVIPVVILQDTMDEPEETVVLALGDATHAGEVAPLVHTLTILDDDVICYGAGTSQVCLDAPPTGTLALSGVLDTDNSTLCAASQPAGWTTAQDPACFVLADQLLINGSTLVFGSRPLVLLAGSAMSVGAMIDAAGHQLGVAGPGAPSAACKAFGSSPGAGNGGGGGAGGSFMSPAGNGGGGDNGASPGGVAAMADPAAPARLRAGCAGQRGGSAGTSQGGTPGAGGGVVYLVSGGGLSFGSNGGVNVSGAGAGPGGPNAGGSGGGSGGMIQLFAPTGELAMNNTTKLVANGGGGASGGGALGGMGGADPVPSTETTPAAGGSGGGANGGNGFAGSTQATSGALGDAAVAGGGGGGGGGYIVANQSLGTADVSAGVVSPSP